MTSVGGSLTFPKETNGEVRLKYSPSFLLTPQPRLRVSWAFEPVFKSCKGFHFRFMSVDLGPPLPTTSLNIRPSLLV